MDVSADPKNTDASARMPGPAPDFRALFEASPGIDLVLAPDAPRFTMLAASDARLKATMTTREETIGRPLFAVFSDANPQNGEQSGVANLRASLETVLRTKAAHRMAVQRYDLAHPDGTWEVRYWAPVNVPVLGAGGEVRYVLHHVEDVTERVLLKRAVDEADAQLAALRESEEAARARLAELETTRERITAVLESISDAFYAVDAEFRFTYVNRRAEELWGRRREDLLGRHYWTEFPKAVGSESYRMHMRVMAERRPLHYETVSPLIGRWIDVSLYPEPGGGLSCYFRDVSERKVAEAERERLLAALQVERSRLAEIFAQTPAILALVRGPDYVFELANEAYLQLIGHRDVIGRPLLEAVPELRGQGFEKLLDRVRETGEPFHGREVPTPVVRVPGAPPETRFFDFVYLPHVEVHPTHGRRISGVIAHGTDVTEQVRARREVERARDRADRLQALTAALAATSTPEEVADVVVAQGVAATAAATGLLALRERAPSADGPGEGLILRHHGVSKALLDGYARFPLTAPGPVAECLRSGTVTFIERGEQLRARFPEVPHIWDSMGTEAVATVPLAVAGDVVGAMSFSWTTARELPEADREFFLALGGQAAQALERARLLAAERASRAQAEQARRDAESARVRTALLQRLTSALSTASTPDQVADAVVTHATSVVGAVGTVIARVTPDGEQLEIMRVGNMRDEIRDEWRRFPLSVPVPLAESARTAQPVFLESREAWAGRYPGMGPLLEANGHHANAVLPLVVDGRVLGVIGTAFDTPRAFAEDDRTLALAVAQQCAQALDRARLFEAERAARAEAEAARVEAEAANRAKSEFLAVMSHELRTPLNAIAGYAELIEMGIRGPVTGPQVEDLRRIQASQRHLLGLVNEVLNYARIETGSVRYDVTEFPLAGVVASVEPLVAPQLAAKGLAFEVRTCDPTPVARADREKVRQVLLNLLSNAVKFTDPGGRVEVSCEADGDRALVRVRDTGIGIATEELERVFEPFVQVNARLTRTQEGVGLGLAISRDLARGMGGDLVAESEPGEGSTFTLALPRAV